jgi:tubulin polyglutamylase TTLL9
MLTKDPYLLGGRKFDMRIYALVTNFTNLTVHTYRTGFARLTTEKYDIQNTQDLYKVCLLWGLILSI